MNKEVNFEIAKILKEKGFDEPCDYYYELEYSHLDPDNNIRRWDVTSTSKFKNSYQWEKAAAPTISEVLMWVYENYGIWITVNLLTDKILNETKDGFFYEINGKGWEVKDIKYSNEFNSPAEAYEAAIAHTLNELI